jgi:hypothetical protein
LEVERFESERRRLDDAIAAQEATCERQQHALRATEAEIKGCKTWLNELPSNARLVEAQGTAGDLGCIRQRIRALRDEIDGLERLPVPSPDIATRIRGYVDQLAAKAQPLVLGIGDRQTLKVLFPLNDHADRRTQTHFAPTDANPLLMAALLDGDRLAERLLAIATSGITARERDEKLRTLRSQLEAARYDEECSICAALDRGEDVMRASAEAWAALQVKVATAKKAAA